MSKTKIAVNQSKLWQTIQEEAHQLIKNEPILARYIQATILKHEKVDSAMTEILVKKLSINELSSSEIKQIIREAYLAKPAIIDFLMTDILAVYRRDPATKDYLTPLLYYKGFLALQTYRIAHWLWCENRQAIATFLQSQIASIFGVDIHPAAKIGCGVMLDHATGIVIGETVVIENDVSILQNVTLGGTGKEHGDRHPKIREGVMIGANATILGNIEIGKGSKIGAGSVVLNSVPPHTTVVGVPAKIVGSPNCEKPALNMDQDI